MAAKPKRPEPVGIEAELITMTKTLMRIAKALEKLAACTGSYRHGREEFHFFRISDLGD